MNRVLTSLNIDWRKYRPTRLRVLVGAAIFLAITLIVSFMQYSRAVDNILPVGSPVGGDYVAFYGAAHAAADGDTATIYDPETFEALLLEIGPPKDHYRLTWQYPPTYFLILAPLALIGFVPGYILWTGLTAAGFFASLRAVSASAAALFVVFASPSVFHAVITGQNGFLTASLLAVAALYPDKRPIAAGLAAALLTVKPQLGLLLPIAYMAGGHWRAFFIAGAGALALAGVSLSLFGVETWIAFESGASGAWENVKGGILPIYKMATPMSAGVLLGLPPALALTVHLIFACATMTAIFFIWRRVASTQLKAAALCAGVLLVAPYGYFYEMVILALPALILAERAMAKGWLPYEQVCLAFAFLAPFNLPGESREFGISWGLLTVLVVAISVVRRIHHEYPNALPKLRFNRSRAPA